MSTDPNLIPPVERFDPQVYVELGYEHGDEDTYSARMVMPTYGLEPDPDGEYNGHWVNWRDYQVLMEALEDAYAIIEAQSTQPNE